MCVCHHLIPFEAIKYKKFLELDDDAHGSHVDMLACCICLVCVAKSLSGFEFNP